MAFSSTTVWEVQTGGDDSNGGGFDPGVVAPGIDYSQQNSPEETYADLVIDATDSTKFTSVLNPVTDDHVGNVVNITSGTGFTVQRVVILSQSGGVATCDKSLGATSSVGGNGKLGGCLATPSLANSLMVASNICWIKSGTYILTSTITIALASVARATRFFGYQTTRGDNTGTRPLITTATDSTVLFTGSGNVSGYEWRNISFSNTASTRARGFRIAATNNCRSFVWKNCIFDGFTNAVEDDYDSVDYGVNGKVLIDCEVKNGTTNGIRVHGSTSIIGCYIHDNAGSGVYCGVNGSNSHALSVSNTIITGNNVGVTLCVPIAIGISAGNGASFINCVIASNTTDGLILPTSSFDHHLCITNSIIAYNGGYGVNYTKYPAVLVENNNAFISNSSGNLYFGENGSIDDSSVILTGDPFTNKGSGDYSLNNTAGAGANCRASAFPGTMKGSTVGYLDMGVAQHQSSGSGVSSVARRRGTVFL